MKRRNVDLAKMRRPIKRNKITEGFYASSTVLYMKLFLVWVCVIIADFLLEFRFEFLWPLYVTARSLYDSFRYQGMAVSAFLVLVTLVSDALCYCFLPVHWLFFAASTYVWVNYVWQTEKSYCLPTLVLWGLFVYLEAAVRLRDSKHMPSHMDLCRPFAAHCIGFPVVRLGIHYKTEVSKKLRERRRRAISKENQFYMQLMQQALPVDTAASTTAAVSVTATTAEGQAQSQMSATQITSSSSVQSNSKAHSKQEKNGHIPNGTLSNGISHVTHGTKSHKKSDKCKNDHNNDHDHSRHSDKHSDKQKVNHVHSNNSSTNSVEDTVPADTETRSSRKKEKKEQDREKELQEYVQRLELDLKKIRTDLQQSRSTEQELRVQVTQLSMSERSARTDAAALQRQTTELQERVASQAAAARASERHAATQLERRLAEERRARQHAEQAARDERRARKQAEEQARQAHQQAAAATAARQQQQTAAAAAAAAAASQAAAASASGDCSDNCRSRRRELESELAELRAARRRSDERLAALERDNAALADQLRDTDILMSALAAVQEKNQHLENSLSAENRVKLDLFSALGEAKRQLEIRDNANRAQEKEIEELKSKIAQAYAVMPDAFSTSQPSPQQQHVSRVRLSDSPAGSKLDPNATAYTPKGSSTAPPSPLVASTEA